MFLYFIAKLCFKNLHNSSLDLSALSFGLHDAVCSNIFSNNHQRPLQNSCMYNEITLHTSGHYFLIRWLLCTRPWEHTTEDVHVVEKIEIHESINLHFKFLNTIVWGFNVSSVKMKKLRDCEIAVLVFIIPRQQQHFILAFRYKPSRDGASPWPVGHMHENECLCWLYNRPKKQPDTKLFWHNQNLLQMSEVLPHCSPENVASPANSPSWLDLESVPPLINEGLPALTITLELNIQGFLGGRLVLPLSSLLAVDSRALNCVMFISEGPLSSVYYCLQKELLGKP